MSPRAIEKYPAAPYEERNDRAGTAHLYRLLRRPKTSICFVVVGLMLGHLFILAWTAGSLELSPTSGLIDPRKGRLGTS
jgi:hypothetical protein